MAKTKTTRTDLLLIDFYTYDPAELDPYGIDTDITRIIDRACMTATEREAILYGLDY